MKRSHCIGLIALFMIACGGNRIDVGETDQAVRPLPPHAPGPDTAPLPGPFPDPNACVGQSDSPLVGKWNGYFGRFQNPTPDFQVDIRGASQAGGVCGTITWGNVAVPPPATDPEAAYPPGITLEVNHRSFPTPGFVYTIAQGRTQGSALALGVYGAQVWDSWCALQTSTYPSGTEQPDDYHCVPNWGGTLNTAADQCTLTDPDGITYSVSCARALLCGNLVPVCQCNAARCVARHDTFQVFDLTVNGDEATGTSSSGEPVVYLHRVP